MQAFYLAHIAESSMRTLDAVFALDAFDSDRAHHASWAAGAPWALQHAQSCQGMACMRRMHGASYTHCEVESVQEASKLPGHPELRKSPWRLHSPWGPGVP